VWEAVTDALGEREERVREGRTEGVEVCVGEVVGVAALEGEEVEVREAEALFPSEKEAVVDGLPVEVPPTSFP